MKIAIKGKNIITTYNHAYYRGNLEDFPDIDSTLTPFEVHPDNFDDVNAGKAIRKMITEQSSCVHGWGFKDQNGNTIGHIYLMSRGGIEVLYRINDIDAYLFAVRVFESFRGNSYSSMMISWLAKNLREKGIKELYLTVKKSNISAIKVYENLGFEKIGDRFFVRIGKVNIPYYSL